jgi:hypothetical protein
MQVCVFGLRLFQEGVWRQVNEDKARNPSSFADWGDHMER